MYRGEIQNDSNGGNYNRSLAYSPSVSGLGDGGRGETRNFAVGAPLRGGRAIGQKRDRSPSPSPSPPPPPPPPAPLPLPAGDFVCGECGDAIVMGTRAWRGRDVLDDGMPLCGDCADNMSASQGDTDGMSEEEEDEEEEEGAGKPFTKKQLTKIILDKNKVIADLEENAYGGSFGNGVTSSVAANRPYVAQPTQRVPVPAPLVQAQLMPSRANQAAAAAAAVVGERHPTDDEQDTLETALKKANAVALTLKGWMGVGMTHGAMNAFIIAFRQAIRNPPELLEALRLNEPLVRQLHGLAPAARDNFISSNMVYPIAISLSKVIREQRSNYDAVYRDIKQKYGGADMMGEGFWEDVRKGLVKHNERKKITPISKEDWKKQMEDFKAPTENWGADELDGGAAPKVEPKVSPVSAAATALQPVRTAIQNKIGDLIYGEETDPKKQKKGLLGISEEGKEESKKKVIKNIVVPAVTLFNDTWDGAFDPEKLKKRRFDESEAAAKKVGAQSNERDGYIFKTPDGKYTYSPEGNEVVRKPRVYKNWIVQNAKKNVGYYRYDMEGKAQGVSPYIKIPNPIKEAGKYYTVDELKKNNIPFFIPVDRISTASDNEERWRGVFEGDEIWVPEDKAREIYQALNQYKVKRAEEKERAYYESLTEVEKKEYREKKALEKDNAMTEAAKAKVEKDIADEEAKEKPDAERLAKMKAAQERVRVKGVENFYKGMTQGTQVSERKYGEQMAANARANEQQVADDVAAFKALSPAERSAQIDAYRKDLQEQGFTDEAIEEAVSQIGADAEGGAGSDDEDDDDESVEEVKAIEVKLSKMERYFVDAPKRNEKGELVGLPLGTYKRAISGVMGIGNRRVYDPESGDVLGYLKDPLWKKVAMKVMKMEKEWREANLKKLGFAMDEDTDGDSVASESSRGGGAKPVEMKQGDYYKEHQNIVKLLKNTGKSLLSEANDQQGEATAMAKKMGAPDPFSDLELVGEGAIEFTLQKAGKSLYNPTGNMTMAGKQTFAPDYDAYGATVAGGRLNAFNLSRSMYNQQQAIDLPNFDLIEDNTSLRFYLKDDEDVILVGIRGTDVKSWTDLYTWAVIGANQDFRMTTRFQDDLQKLLVFQKEFPMTQYYYVGVGSSLAGSIADRFLDMGLLDEAITYNPSIEKKYVLDGDIHNHRIFLDTDPLFILMGQYAPNTEIRVNAGRADFYNPIKEKDYLIKSHSIFPVYNPAFEGGGMMGAGKTYTIEEWKAIFDAKLEKKRQQIEAREAKKKQTAKAKRERAKARRDGRDEPPPLETPATFRTSRVMKATPPKQREPEPEPEEEEEDVEVTTYKYKGKEYDIEDPRGTEDMNLEFYANRDVWEDNEPIGKLGDKTLLMKALMKLVIKAEFPSEKVYRETMGLEAPPKKPRFKIVAPASARVELREELVAEQPRQPSGEFAQEAEPLQLVVSEIAKQPQGAFMKLMKSPKLTEADRRLFMRLKDTKMTPKMRAILLGRSGLARRVMEIMGLDESAFQTKKARLKIADTTEMRVKSETAREIDAQGWIDIKKEWKRAATEEINSVLYRTGNGERAVKSAKDRLKNIAKWCIDSVECLRDAMITDWQGAWTINQEGREVDADGDRFYSKGKVGTDVGKNKTPLLTIKDTTKTASDTSQEDSEVRTYNLVIGGEGQAILLDGGGDGYEKWTIPMRTLYGFFPLMGLPIPTCKKQGRYGMMKLEIDWKEMPLVRSYKSLTAKAKEEIQEKLRSEYAPKLTALIDMSRSKLEDCVEEAIKGRVKVVDDGKWRPMSKWYTDRSWQPE